MVRVRDMSAARLAWRMALGVGAILIGVGAASAQQTAPPDVNVTVEGAPVPPKCSAFDAYYLGCRLAN
jgi:hypothetical protein